MTLKSLIFLFPFLLFFYLQSAGQCLTQHATNYYWKGNATSSTTADYNTGTNWWIGSFNSGLSACEPPNSTDTVYFIDAAFPSDGTVTISGFSNCYNMIWDPFFSHTVSLSGNSSSNLQINGSLYLSPTMNITYNGGLSFTGQEPGKQYNFDPALQTLNLYNIYVRLGPSSELKLLSGLRLECPLNNSATKYQGALVLESGHLNTNGQELRLDAFQSTNNNPTRQLTLDNSKITVDVRGWYPGIWQLDFNGSNFAGFSAVGSHLIVQPSATTDVVRFGSNLQYDSVTIDAGLTRLYLENSSDFNYFALSPGCMPVMPRSGTISTDELVMGEGSVFLMYGVTIETDSFRGPTGCEAASIQKRVGSPMLRKKTPGGTLQLNNVLLNGISGDLASSYDAINSFDAGGNSNITFSTGFASCHPILYFRDNVSNNWNDLNNWQTGPSATAPIATQLPSLETNVIIDNLSFSTLSNGLSLSQAAYCKDITSSGLATSQNLTLNYPLYITGNVNLDGFNSINGSNSGWEMSRGFVLYGNNTSSNRLFNTNGTIVYPKIVFSSNSDYTIVDTLKTFTIQAFPSSMMRANNAGIEAYNIGFAGRDFTDTRVYFIAGGWPSCWATDNSNYTYNGNCTFYFNGNAGSVQTVSGYLPNVVIDHADSRVVYPSGIQILGDLTINKSIDFTLQSRGYSQQISWNIAGNLRAKPGVEIILSDNIGSKLSVGGNFISQGTCTNMTTLRSFAGGTTEIDVTGTTTIQNNYLKGLNFTNSATVNDCIDGGNNSNINFTAGSLPKTFYWRAHHSNPVDFEGNWSDPGHWTDNPANLLGDSSCLPSARDHVTFDNLSFSSTSNGCTIDNNAYCNRFLCTAGITLNSVGTGQGNLFVGGDFQLDPTTTFNYSGYIRMIGSGNITTANNDLLIREFILDNPSGVWILQDSLFVNGYDNNRGYGVLRLNAGTLQCNSQNVRIFNRFEASNSNSRSIDMSNSQWTFLMRGYYYRQNPGYFPWNSAITTNFSITHTNSKISFLDGLNALHYKEFRWGSGLNLPYVFIQDHDETIYWTGSSQYQYLEIDADLELLNENTIDSLALYGGHLYTLMSNNTQTLNSPHGKILAKNVGASSPINLECSSSTDTAFIHKAYGDGFCLDYIKVRNVKATKEINNALIPTSPINYQTIHPFLLIETGINSDNINGSATGIWAFSLPPLIPPASVGDDTVTICKTGLNLFYEIQITGSSPYIIDYSWTDNLSNSGAQSGILVADDDNNSSTPFTYRVPLNPTASSFDYTVNVSTVGCGDAFVSNPVNTHVIIPTPAPLVAVQRTGSCTFNNEGAWFALVDQVDERPILSLRDSVDNSDITALGLVQANVQFEPSVQFLSFAGQTYPFLQRHWEIIPQTNDRALVRLYFTQSELDSLAAYTFWGNNPFNAANSLNPSTEITVLKYENGINSLPVSVIPHTVVPLTAASASPFSTTTGLIAIEFVVSSFSQFAIIPTSLTLLDAANLSQFEVQRHKEKQAKISWSIKEIDALDYFEVQHSLDFAEISPLGTVQPQIAQIDYSFIDKSPANGPNYYRLNIFKKDGSNYYSDWRHLNVEQTGLYPIVFPNPSRHVINIQFVQPTDDAYQWLLIDALGQIIIRGIAEAPNTGAPVTIATDKLASGVYSLQLINNVTKASKMYPIIKQ
jgi:hypothetical protein